MSGSWVSGNVRCRDIRQPPHPTHRTFLTLYTLLPPPAPSVWRTNPIPATEPDRRTTGSSSSSPLIRLSRYRHRRPGNLPVSPLSSPTGSPPFPPPFPAVPRSEVQPRYPHPLWTAAPRRRHAARCVGVQCTVWRGRHMHAARTLLST